MANNNNINNTADNRIFRVIDVNLNRVAEGLRVVEDICRYMVVLPKEQQQLKTLRHELRRVSGQNRFLSRRDADNDTGFASHGSLEYRRSSVADILQANCKRIQEGYRSLEELFKLEDETVAGRMKAARYQSYSLEQTLAAALQRKQLRTGLYLVLTEPETGYEAITEMAVTAGIAAVQLRYKGDDDRLHLQLAHAMRAITRGSKTLFIVNDRADIGMLSDADGIHVGQEDIPVKEIRAMVGTDMLLGLSTHNLDQVQQANREQVDYIGFGPLYPTTSKDKPDPVTGPDILKEAGESSVHPIVAIGGLTPERINRLDPKSYHNVAVIRAVTGADEPLAAMEKIHKTACSG